MANSPVGIYQAEDAELVTGTQSTATRHIQVKSDQNGYEGEGYVDYGDGIDSGETITWTLGSDQAGEFDLAFRYALTTGSRPLLLTVNGGDPITLDFSATGSASTWGTLVQRVTLNESEENVITLTSFENSGANIDQLEVLAVAEPDDGSADEDNNLALIALDSTITGEEAQAVPFQVTGLDDDIETVEISVNDGARRAISLNAEGRFAVDLSGLADGDVTATLFVTDNAGNQATASTAFTLDTGPDDSAYTSPVGVYQAEDAALATGPESTTSNYIRVNDSQAGYEGEGYADYGNGVDRGESITWTIGSDQTGEFDLAFRYALTTGTRPLLLNINGGETVTLDFSATGSATTWDTLTQRVTLAGGQENIITLTSFENSGANIDQLEILPITSAEDTTADKNGDLGLDVLDATIDTTEIAAVPFHITGLDADVKTIAVSFDDGETRLDVTPNNQGDFTLDLTGYEQGKHTATLYVTDEAGNEASTTTSVTIESEEADPGIEPANRFEVKINFQPAIDAAAYNPNFVTPEGYIADEGLAFGQQTVTVGGKVYQYGWVSEDSIADGTANGTTPLSLKDQADLAVNDRTDDIEGLDPLQGTYAHFALPSYAENAGWEMELENGFYEVTLSIGDTSGEYDSHNVINAEGELFNDPFTPFRPDDFPDDSNPADDTEGFRSDLVTRIVEVTDGRLTLDSLGAGSSNTEIQYLEIKGLPDLTPGDERSAPEDYAHFTNPRAVSGVGTNEIAIDLDPDNGAMPTGVGPDSDIFIGVSVVDGRGGTLLESLQDGSVRLFETVTGKEVAFNINTTGGFDSLTISPKDGLKEFTSYTIKIEGFQDRGDNDNPDAPTREFQTFTTTFVTGDAPESVAREVAFTKNIELNGSEDNAYGFTSVELSPDGSKLYIATMAGEIKRYDVDPDTGGLSGEQTLTLDYFQDEDGPRGIIGLTFDPNDASTLWVTDNYPIPLSGRSESVPDFSGRITKITLGDGPEFTATADPYITGLPRSVADHVSNSLEFRVNPDYDAVTNPDVPTHLLYVIQGSDSAMGEPDSAWGSRPERLLNAAVLEIDPTRTPPEGGFDVSTEPLPDNGRRYADDDNDLKNDPIPMGDGEYLVFAENGTATVQNDEGAILEQFYDPYADDAVLKIFATGIRNGYDLVWHSNGQLYVPTNGSAAGGSVPDDPSTSVDESQVNVSKQDDYLFTVEEGGYYGHPNPLHDQYIMNGGNPTSAEDVNQVDDYPVGQEPDPNYRIEDAYSLGENRSPNGATEYTSDVFGSSLQHNLLFTEYSGGDDIRSITLDEDGNIIGDDVLRDINGNVIRYVDSLDIIENPATGQLYLLTLNRNNGQSQLVRLDPAPGGVVTDPTGGDEDDRVSILTIQAEDNTPDDGTSVAIADAEIQIRNENNPESSGLRPGAYGLDGNTNNSDGVMGGYADFGSTNDDFITFTFELTEAQAGESVLQVRYANGGTTSRPLEAVINQESAGTFAFNPPAGITGDAAWSTWQLLDIRADLVAGVNTVTFQATSGTGPNIDQLEVFAVEAPDDSADADNNLALAALDTVLEGDEAETATFQVSGLDDDIETLEVSFNGGERITVVPDDSGQFSLDVSALPDGEVTATLFVTDAAGNEATAATDFTLDTTPGEPVFTTPVGTYQAEDAELGTGPESTSDNYIQEVADQAGYLGDGFVDYGDGIGSGETLTWTIGSDQTGEFDLALRYSLASGTRPLALTVNGGAPITLDFTATGSFSTWQNLTQRVTLIEGQENVITLTSTGSSGPNIDQLEILAVEASDDSADADNNLALAALDTVLEGDEAETATFQVSGLDDDIETLEVSFNGGERITVVPDDSGQFSLDVSALPDGEVTATLFVTDAAGNEATAATDFTLDTTPGEPVFTTPVGTYQAEDAELGTGPESTSDNYIQEVADQAGYLGDGFVDYGDGIGSGETLTWTIGSDQTGEFDLALRYSLASGTRPLALTVNGGAPITLDFTATGSFSTWQTLTQRVTLIEGQENVITLTSTGSSGPNIDQLEVLAVEASDDSADADNNLALAALDTVLEGDEAETATFQVSGLDDDIETLEVSFNDGERIIVVPDDSGQFSVDVSALPDGEVTATLFVTDAAGNEATAAADFLLDTTPDEPEDPTPGYTEYEAESAELDGGPAVVADPLTSGGSYVDFAGSGDQTVTWTIDVAEAGMYEVGFRYALDSTKDDRPLGLSVNGNTASALNFIGQTNANWDDWYYRTTAVSLDAGSNTITVTAPNANGPNIDSLQVATSPIPTDPGANIALQSDDAGYYADRIHFNYLENNSASSPNRDFKESGSVVVSNTGTAELSILKADLSGPFELADPTIFEDLTLAAGESITVDILFDRDAYTPPATDAGDGVFKGTLQLTTNDADTPIAEMHLAGFWQARDEGGWEPNVNEVWEVFGFGNVIEGLPTVQAGENSVLNDHDLYRPVNDDEVLSRYWKIAEGFNSAKITQLAAFHGSGAAYLGIHNPDNKGQVVQLTNHAGDNNQSLLPIENDGQFATATFYHNTIPDSWKGNDLFSIIVQGLSTDPSLNPTGSGDVPEDAEGIERGYTVRMFQALDANGNAIPNTYLGIMDYTGINYDYNDNMFVIEGIEPASLFEPVAAGDLSIENLDGIPSDDRLVMSRIENPANDSQEVHDEATFSINNNGSADFAVTRLEIADPSLFEIVGDTQNLMVPAGGSLNVTVRFIAEDTNDGSLYESTLLVHANGSETPQAVVQLAGIAQGQSEHGQEPTVQEIVDAFGFSTDVAQEQMNQGGLVEANGDEIIAPYFQRADSSSPIKITQLAAYHTQGDIARLFVHDVGSRDLNEILAHDELDGQTLLPRTLNDGDSLATTTLDRDAPFGFFAGISGRQGYISWSDPDANLYEDSVDAIGNPGTNLNWNADDGHLIRVYIAKDSAGNVIPDTYIVIQDYAGVNYDYNDNIFLVENVQTYDPSGTEDADGNGRVDLYDDNDGDGIPNFQDTEEGTTEQHPHNDTQQPWFVDQDGLTLDAARYDEGGQGIAYNDSSESQLGSNFRGEGVDILGDGDAVGWVTDGEWLEYTLDVAQAGTYNLSFLTALGNQSGGRSITADFTQAGETYASLSPVAIDYSGSWDTYTDSDAIQVELNAGEQVLRLTFNGGSQNLASFELDQAGASGQLPFNADHAPWQVGESLSLDAVLFDEGGQDVAYSDAEAAQLGSDYRQEGVDILDDGTAIGWIRDGEWVEYTLDVEEAGTYDLSFMVATPNAGRSIAASVEQDGSFYENSGPVAVPSSGDWNDFVTTQALELDLQAGEQTLRLSFNGGSMNLQAFTLDREAAFSAMSATDDSETLEAMSGQETDTLPETSNVVELSAPLLGIANAEDSSLLTA